MIVGCKPYQSIWMDENDNTLIRFINQQVLPFEFRVDTLSSSSDVISAIREMKVRGAPLIGAAAAFGVYLACLEAGSNDHSGEDALETIRNKASEIKNTRPTAVNLAWAVDRVLKVLEGKSLDQMIRYARKEALNILTHCNAGWLACIDYGTATAPIYMAHDMGLPVHVWVDETRPRNQGARLTAWELGQHGVPHTVIVDNAGGHLMQQGRVDMVLVGSDRTTRRGDVANKIGTYPKALAAHDNDIPFYVALPSSSIDFTLGDGLKEIPIEERDGGEVRFMEGILEGVSEGALQKVQIMPENCPVSNFGFDVTPSRLVTGLITEKGICEASEKGILGLFPERR